MQQFRDMLPPPVDGAALAARALPAPVEACLQAALAGQALPAVSLPWQLRDTPAGGKELWELGDALSGSAPRLPRRWAAWSRGGALSRLLHWAPPQVGGGLLRADVACPAGRWAQLLPGGAIQPLWGDSDRLCFGTVAQPAAGTVLLPAQDYGALRRIPPVDQPALLLPGVGAAVLNLLATLMADQGLTETGYTGPYPTPALFDALCGCFVPLGDPAAAREAFTRHAVAIAFSGELVDSPVSWRPNPWEALHGQVDAWLQWRDGPQVLWLGGQAFPACPAQAPLPLGRRLWPADGGGEAAYQAGLVFLGQPYRHDADLDGEGRLLSLAAPEPVQAVVTGRPLGMELAAAVFAWAKVGSTAALAPALADLADEWQLAWADLGAELAVAQAPTLLLNQGLVAQYQRLAAGSEPGPLAMMLVSDACQAAAPLLARLAQQRLARAQPPPDPNALMHAGRQIQQRAQAQLAEALPPLVAALAQGKGLQAD